MTQQTLAAIEHERHREMPVSGPLFELSREAKMTGATLLTGALFLAIIGSYVWLGTFFGYHNFR